MTSIKKQLVEIFFAVLHVLVSLAIEQVREESFFNLKESFNLFQPV